MKRKKMGIRERVEEWVMRLGERSAPDVVPPKETDATSSPRRMGWRAMREVTRGLAMRPVARKLAVILVLFLLVKAGLLIGWSREPRPFDVMAVARERAEQHGHLPTGAPLPPGYVAVSTVLRLTETLLDRPGGYLSNDRVAPTAHLDNMPSWEYGVLLQVRDFVSALRQDFSRQRAQSEEYPSLVEAEARFSYEHTQWILPSTEHEYRLGVRHLQDFLTVLSDPSKPGAAFSTRPDQLASWLRRVERRLGAQTIRLRANAVDYAYNPYEGLGMPLLPSTFGQEALPQEETGTTLETSSNPTSNRTPWMDIDNVFYEARGTAWATYHLLLALRHEFEAVLIMHQSLGTMNRALSDLRAALAPVRSPLILNGKEFGMTPNHSIMLAAYLAKAHVSIADLRLLKSGGTSARPNRIWPTYAGQHLPFTQEKTLHPLFTAAAFLPRQARRRDVPAWSEPG
jgi:hypothetical protein